MKTNNIIKAKILKWLVVLLVLTTALIFGTTVNAQITTYPHKTDFEGSLGSDWRNSLSDDFDWTHKLGASTPSSGTGPQAFPYGGNNTDGYAFIESSSPRAAGEQAWLECTYDFSTATSASFSFYYHMYSANGNWIWSRSLFLRHI